MQKIKKDVFLFSQALEGPTLKKLLEYYNFNKDYIYQPELKSGHKMFLSMFQAGKHWNAKDYKYYDHRSDVDNLPVLPYPDEINEMVAKLSLAAFPYHNPDWDILICNAYSKSSKLGLHRDNSESAEALHIGHPVVSISLGASCIFQIGGNKRSDQINDVKLSHGDVLIFGGEARQAFHGVHSILDDGEARINFTLRKY